MRTIDRPGSSAAGVWIKFSSRFFVAKNSGEIACSKLRGLGTDTPDFVGLVLNVGEGGASNGEDGAWDGAANELVYMK